MRELIGGAILAVVAAISVAACSDNSSDQGATGGASNGGAAGLANGVGGSSGVGGRAAGGLGGFAGAAPVSPQGALSTTVGRPVPQVAGKTCPSVSTTYEIGAPDAPSTADPGESVVSGAPGTSITCSVTGRGPFSFSGMLHGVTAQGDVVSINFSNGSIAADGTGSADVALYTAQLAAEFSGTACSVVVLEQQIKSGSIWASFECPQIDSAPSGACALEGVIVFENCDGA